ncbi:DUF7282 domain-containing protein [Halorarius halobius]|uniref:DUF7282 domain-containing protein n=1 Tax=Halorarius halobius TaxID=2962671 RepID=UPI0020CC3825|nr:hypothetical protein [Halorarius halobius]
METRHAVGLLAAGLVVAALAAAVPMPASAHVNHVAADPQVSPDGRLVAETAFVAVDGYLVVHRDDDGAVGEPIGHAPISQAGGLKTDVSVTVADGAWDDWTTDEAWLVLHTSDGDGEFEPDDDEMLTTFGQPAGERITVARGDRALVTAAAFAPQRVNASGGAVTVRTATLPTDGAVLVRNGSDGEVVGRANLSAGTHANVSVPIDESFLDGRDRFTPTAVLVDGDGEPLTAGDAAVATTFGARVRGGAEGTTTPTPPVVQTATPTPASETTAATTSESTDTPTPTDGGGPGFGLAAALAALAAVALLRRV